MRWTPEPALSFTLDGTGYEIPLRSVLGVAGCGPLRAVPGAPAALVGLVEWRGALLTVFDLEALLGHEAGASEPSVIRLADPLRGAALRLRADIRLRSGHDAAEATAVRLDPLALVRAVDVPRRGAR